MKNIFDQEINYLDWCNCIHGYGWVMEYSKGALYDSEVETLVNYYRKQLKQKFWDHANKSLAKNPLTCKGKGIEHALYDHIIYTKSGQPTHRIKHCYNCWRTIETYDYYTNERII